jgi:hypothetical protein
MAGSSDNNGGCQFAGGPLAGASVQAAVGVLQGLGNLIPFSQIVRTAVFAPNDLAAIAFDPNLSGRLAVGTGAGAVTVCSSAPDCAGQPNQLPLAGLDSATGGVPAACIANGVNAGCDLANLRNAFAFGVPSTGNPPTCTNPSSVTVNTALCAPAPTDGFTLHQGEAIVFVHDHSIGGLGYGAGVAGFGVSLVPVDVCSSGGVVGSTTGFDSTP